EFTFSVDDFRTVFQSPRVIDNNNAEIVKPPTLTMMLAFLNEIEYATRIRVDQPPLQMMQMLYCIINNVHVDYAALLWEGLHYSHLNLTRAFPYPRFTKIIVDHILTENPNISKRLNEPYHRVANNEVVKSIFNYGKRKGLGMRIPEWMLTEEMKLTKHYKLYVEEFGIVVPITQSRPIESTQGTIRTPSAPRPPNPQEQQGESSAPKKSTIIRIPRRRQPDPETPILTAA
ncbi:hypothetical protein Tco_1411563, partial [Tanacetum coccineum]